jgi:hypothetical protein
MDEKSVTRAKAEKAVHHWEVEFTPQLDFPL